jgi:uncharacterized protein (DUF1501 family)
MANNHQRIVHQHIARREFLKRAASIGAFTGTSFAANLATLGDAAAQTATDFKALVCVFLLGGNDQSNTIIPTSTAQYNQYVAARNGVALPLAGLLPITPVATATGAYSGPTLALHPQLGGVKRLFDSGKCAILANVATLVQPTTKAQYQNDVFLPAQLFSHSDQQNSWQTGLPDSPSQTGWLGRVGDLMFAQNGTSPVSICMSLAGNNTIQAGTNVIQYQLTNNGSVQIEGISQQNGLYGSTANASLLQAVLQESSSNILENEFAKIATRSISADGAVRAALATAPATTSALIPGNPLSAQLNLVARMIAARNSLGHKRQIYFVSLGGFDFHSNLVNDQSTRLGILSSALEAFYNATVALNIQNNVTAFTASDFGRALLANGDGSDHGWGGHHFIIGGAVQGQRLYGRFPDTALKSADDAGEGRLIPTTSVDEYAATLAKWFGVTSTTDLATVLPHLSRFANYNTAFL